MDLLDYGYIPSSDLDTPYTTAPYRIQPLNSVGCKHECYERRLYPTSTRSMLIIDQPTTWSIDSYPSQLDHWLRIAVRTVLAMSLDNESSIELYSRRELKKGSRFEDVKYTVELRGMKARVSY